MANHESNLVSVIDTSDNDVLAEVPVQTSPHSLAVNPSPAAGGERQLRRRHPSR